MKKRFTEEQIIGFLREAEAGMPAALHGEWPLGMQLSPVCGKYRALALHAGSLAGNKRGHPHALQW